MTSRTARMLWWMFGTIIWGVSALVYVLHVFTADTGWNVRWSMFQIPINLAVAAACYVRYFFVRYDV